MALEAALRPVAAAAAALSQSEESKRRRKKFTVSVRAVAVAAQSDPSSTL